MPVGQQDEERHTVIRDGGELKVTWCYYSLFIRQIVNDIEAIQPHLSAILCMPSPDLCCLTATRRRVTSLSTNRLAILCDIKYSRGMRALTVRGKCLLFVTSDDGGRGVVW